MRKKHIDEALKRYQKAIRRYNRMQQGIKEAKRGF